MCAQDSMDKSYSPADIEKRIYAHWEASGWFAPAGDGAPYSIVIPPPNVTGTLHMGHAFQHTLMDALTRYHRMEGRRTLWQPGTDHAGIATQMVVERQLNQQGTTFVALLAELRREMAPALLRDGRHGVSEVAFLLGYEDPSAFRRAFKRWFGRSPRSLRAAGDLES